MMGTIRARRSRRRGGELRALLRRWDPKGVFHGDDLEADRPEDAYDCLIPGLYERLRAGASEEEFLAFLERELVDRFGLSARPVIDRQFTRELLAWWDAGS
jgi:hypothetical protein